MPLKLYITVYFYMHFSYEQRGQETTRSGSHGFENKTEAMYIKIFIRHLIDEGVHKHYGIAILTPYKGQVAMIENHIGKSMRKSIKYIGTVDGYQGSENDVIIISMVRSSNRGKLGFCNDLRRINVTLTRAKKACYVFGHHRTLTRHIHGETNHIKKMIVDAKQRGLVQRLKYDYSSALLIFARVDDISYLGTEPTISLLDFSISWWHQEASCHRDG